LEDDANAEMNKKRQISQANFDLLIEPLAILFPGM